MTVLAHAHGETRGWVAGCRERCCREAINAYNRKRNSDISIYGDAGRRQTDATGTRRRIQALMLLGWSSIEIARAGGWKSGQAVTCLLAREVVLKTTARRIDEAHETLWRRYLRGDYEDSWVRRRTSAQSREKGWVSAAAWDNIDDPSELPHGALQLAD